MHYCLIIALLTNLFVTVRAAWFIWGSRYFMLFIVVCFWDEFVDLGILLEITDNA
jgi:hypothetical protein